MYFHYCYKTKKIKLPGWFTGKKPDDVTIIQSFFIIILNKKNIYFQFYYILKIKTTRYFPCSQQTQ